MDITRFETLLRSLSLAGTRRRALAVLLGWLTPALRLTEAEAGKKGKKRRRRKRRRRRNEARSFCAGKNTCADISSTCQRSGPQSNCHVNAETGESSCLDFASSRFVTICDDCASEETCVDFRAAPCTGTGFFCLVPCPNPL